MKGMLTDKWLKIVLLLVFPLSIPIDLINGYTQVQMGIHLPIGIIYNSFILFILLRDFLGGGGGRRWTSYLILLCMTLFVSIGYWNLRFGADPFFEVSTLVRSAYFFLMIVFFKKNGARLGKDMVYSFVTNYGLLVACCLIFSSLTGLGNVSYRHGFGTQSYFRAGNDLGITVLFAAVFGYLQFLRKGTFLAALKCLVILGGMPLLGSRLALAGSFITFLLSLGHFALYGSVGRKARWGVLALFVPLLCGGVLLIADYIQSQFNAYMWERIRLENTISARDYLMHACKTYIGGFEGMDWIVGRGLRTLFFSMASSLGYSMELENGKGVEADFHELIGGYGVVGGFLLMLPYLHYARRSVTRFFSSKTVETFFALYLFCSFVFVGYMSGHTLHNTMVAPIYAAAVVFLPDETRRRVRV